MGLSFCMFLSVVASNLKATSGNIILWEYENCQDPDQLNSYELYNLNREHDELANIKALLIDAEIFCNFWLQRKL